MMALWWRNGGGGSHRRHVTAAKVVPGVVGVVAGRRRGVMDDAAPTPGDATIYGLFHQIIIILSVIAVAMLLQDTCYWKGRCTYY